MATEDPFAGATLIEEDDPFAGATLISGGDLYDASPSPDRFVLDDSGSFYEPNMAVYSSLNKQEAREYNQELIDLNKGWEDKVRMDVFRDVADEGDPGGLLQGARSVSAGLLGTAKSGLQHLGVMEGSGFQTARDKAMMQQALTEEMPYLGQMATGAAESFTKMAILAPGGFATIAAGFMADSANDAYADTGDATYAIGMGVLEGTFMTAAQMIGFGGIEKSALRTLAGNVMKGALGKRIARSMAEEEVEELLTGYSQLLWGGLTGAKEVDWEKDWKRVFWDTTVQTGMTIGLMESANTAVLFSEKPSRSNAAEAGIPPELARTKEQRTKIAETAVIKAEELKAAVAEGEARAVQEREAEAIPPQPEAESGEEVRPTQQEVPEEGPQPAEEVRSATSERGIELGIGREPVLNPALELLTDDELFAKRKKVKDRVDKLGDKYEWIEDAPIEHVQRLAFAQDEESSYDSEVYRRNLVGEDENDIVFPEHIAHEVIMTGHRRMEHKILVDVIQKHPQQAEIVGHLNRFASQSPDHAEMIEGILKELQLSVPPESGLPAPEPEPRPAPEPVVEEAVPEPEAEPTDDGVGIRKAFVIPTNEEMGNPALPTVDGEGQQFWREEAIATGKVDEVYDIAALINKNPRQLTPVESAAFGLKSAEVLRARKAATARRRAATTEEDKSLAFETEERMREEYNFITSASSLAGGLWSQVGSARQIRIDDDFELETMTLRAEKEAGGPLDEKQKARLADIAEKVEAKEIEVAEGMQKVNDAVALEAIKTKRPGEKKQTKRDVTSAYMELGELIAQGCLKRG